MDEPWGPVVIPDEAPAAGDERVVGWFADELAQIDAFLEALDPDVPTWNWAPQTRTASFWHRRTAHETAVHRWDAQFATRLPEPLESKLAADTVDEALDTFLPAGRRRPHEDVSGLVHLVATDVGQEWYVRMRGDGIIALLDTDTLLDDDAHPARAWPPAPRATWPWPSGGGSRSTCWRRPGTRPCSRPYASPDRRPPASLA